MREGAVDLWPIFSDHHVLLQPEPNIRTNDLYRFDSIASLGRQSLLRLGVRNKLQTKKEGRPFDLVDLDTWVEGNFNAGENESTFGFLYWDTRLRPWNSVSIDCDGKFSLSDGAAEEANLRLTAGDPSAVSTDLEYRFRRNRSSLLGGRFAYSPNPGWSYTYTARYEIEDSRLEEHTLWVQRNYDCMCVALGFSQIPSYTLTDGSTRNDEYQVLFRMWLKAFPKFGLTVE